MTAIVWKLQAPASSNFASLKSIYVKQEQKLCENCGLASIPELLVEWDDGSDQVGDFTRAGGRIVVTDVVADALLEKFSGFEKRPLKMVDHPNLYRPKKLPRSAPRRVWLPYEGPPLCELWIANEVNLSNKSTVEIGKQCDKCGALSYRSFDGIEIKNSRRHVPRQPGKGLFVAEAELDACDFFKPRFTGLLLCTDAVKQFVEGHNYSNVEFLEAGELVA